MKSARLLLLAPSLLVFSSGLCVADDMAGMPGMSGTSDQSAQHGQMSMLTPAQKQFLAGYEAVRAALALDDLDAAKGAAAALGGSGAAMQLATADSLDMARMAFKKLSDQAVQYAKGQPGYYVFNCPMAMADWVQTTRQVSNPYLGKKLPKCGSLKE